MRQESHTASPDLNSTIRVQAAVGSRRCRLGHHDVGLAVEYPWQLDLHRHAPSALSIAIWGAHARARAVVHEGCTHHRRQCHHHATVQAHRAALVHDLAVGKTQNCATAVPNGLDCSVRARGGEQEYARLQRLGQCVQHHIASFDGFLGMVHHIAPAMSALNHCRAATCSSPFGPGLTGGAFILKELIESFRCDNARSLQWAAVSSLWP